MSARRKLSLEHAAFLSRFVGRGWLHATRSDAGEQHAVDAGLRLRLLRREMGEAHFTPKGRQQLVAMQASS